MGQSGMGGCPLCRGAEMAMSWVTPLQGGGLPPRCTRAGGHCQKLGTPRWGVALAVPGHHHIPPGSHASLPGFFASRRSFGFCCQNPSALQPCSAARVPARPRGDHVPLMASSCKLQGPHCLWLWPVPPALAPPGASGKGRCEITPENAYFYVFPTGLLVFLGQRFEATWSVTCSLGHPDGTTGHQVWHFRQKVGITLSRTWLRL